jgi:hypothetical protein
MESDHQQGKLDLIKTTNNNKYIYNSLVQLVVQFCSIVISLSEIHAHVLYKLAQAIIYITWKHVISMHLAFIMVGFVPPYNK